MDTVQERTGRDARGCGARGMRAIPVVGALGVREDVPGEGPGDEREPSRGKSG
jgi:hypothetical protein